MQQTIWIRLATFVMWLLAAGSLVYWALKFVSGPSAPSAVSAAPAPGTGQVDAQALARGLGGGLPSTPNSVAESPSTPVVSNISSSRFQLTGVVLSRGGSNRNSVALLAVDGKPPRPYRVGANLADGVVLHSVAPGKVMLASSSQAKPELVIELPKITSAVVGTAVAMRPVASAAPISAPASVISAPTFGSIPVGAPGAVAGLGAVPASSTAATTAATATVLPSATGQRGSRPGANRQREGQPVEAQQPAQ